MAARGLRGHSVAILADLPAADRDVLLLLAWEQFSYDEIARALEIPVGTVRSRLNRSRNRLRRALAGLGYPESAMEILGDE